MTTDNDNDSNSNVARCKGEVLYSEQELREHIIDCYNEHGRPPLAEDMYGGDGPSRNAYPYRFGLTFEQYRDKVLHDYDDEYSGTDSSSGPPREYSDEDLREWIIVWYEAFGVAPRYSDFQGCPETPTPCLYRRHLKPFCQVRDEVLEKYLEDYDETGS